MGAELHEAGHLAVGRAFGWSATGVTVEPGSCFAGFARQVPQPVAEAAWDRLDVELPFVLWPAEVRGLFESTVIVSMAGDLSALMLAPPRLARPGRVEATIAEQAEERFEALAALPESAPADVEAIRKVVDTPGPSDAAKVAELTFAAFGLDNHAGAATWLAFCEQQCRSLIAAEARRIEHMAAVLAVRHTLTGEQVAAVLRDRSRNAHP